MTANTLEAQKERERTRSCCCGYKSSISVLTLGTLIAIAANFLPKLYKDTVKKSLVLEKGNEAYNNWLSPPAPVYMTYYIFNYTNAVEVMAETTNPIKPNVTQLGPYVYREIRTNVVLEGNEHNITYLNNYTFVFDQSKSCSTCKENDTVYVPAIATMTILQKIYEKFPEDPGFVTRFPINAGLSLYAALFKKLTVKEVLWGYDDDLLHRIKTILELLSMKPISSRIALQMNGTEGAEQTGNITILTGKDDLNNVQRIVRWRGLDNAPYWLTKYGRMINGTDGSRTKPFVTRDFRYYVFVTQLCRSLYFEYEKDVRYREIDLFRFTTTKELFASKDQNADNAAFCSDNTTCWGSGLLCLSKCQEGNVPIFMSAPHFYEGDFNLSQRINGLNPNKELHSTFADVEPITGITMRAKKRLQINVMGQRFWTTISQSMQYDHNFYPVLFVEEGADIDEASASLFRNMVLTPKMFMTGKSPTIIMGAGILLIVVSMAMLLVLLHRRGCLSSSSSETDTVSVKRMVSTQSAISEKDGIKDLEISIHKVDSRATIINNSYTDS